MSSKLKTYLLELAPDLFITWSTRYPLPEHFNVILKGESVVLADREFLKTITKRIECIEPRK